VRRRLFYIIGGVVGSLLLCLTALFWLIDTTAGARFALETMAAAAGAKVSVGGIQGRLLDRLQLTGVRVSKPRLQAQIDRLDLAWDPLQIFSGNLSVRELSISGVRIQDDQPPSVEPPKLHWPRVSGWLRRLDASMSSFKLKGLSYRHLQEPPVVVTEISTSISLKAGLLSFSEFRFSSPEGRVSGEIATGFSLPTLRIDLVAVPSRPMQGMDLFSLQARLLPGRGPEQLSGGIALAGRSGGVQRLELSAELGMTDQLFTMRRLNFVRPGRRGTLTGEGSMTLTAAEPLFSLALKAADLDLEEELKLPTRLSGTLNFAGGLSRFQGKFALANSGPGWQSASLSADYLGDSAGLKLAQISGTLLDGRLGGALDVAWSKGVRISGTLAGRGLNPGRLAADWKGLINLDLTGRLELPEQGALRGELRGKLLESRLHGQDLQGEVQAAFAGERLRIDRLLLTGKGFDLRGAGELDRRLDLTAKVSDLSRLLPGTAGALQVDGWVCWRDRLLTGAANGQGSNLAVAGMRAASLQLKASLGEGKDYPLLLDASLSRLQLGTVRIESALVGLQGTAAKHLLNVALSSPGSEAQLTLAGGYGNGVWNGELTRLAGRDQVGPWSLAAPAPLAMSAERFRLAPLVLNGLPGERIELSGNLNRHPLSGAMRGVWSKVNLARANGWLDGVELAGGSSGLLNLSLLPGERLLLSGRADAQGTLIEGGRRINLERLAATIEGNGRGLRASLDLALQGGAGQAHLLFDSSVPATLSLPRQGELTLQWSDLDLALLRPMMPPNFAVDGRLAGLVNGTLLPGGRLDLKGKSALAGGHLNWREQGQEFDASLNTAEVDFRWRGGLSGAGQLRLTGLAAATGYYTANGQRIVFERSTLRLDADQNGTRAAVDLALAGGGSLRASLSSAAPAGLSLPETGDLAMEWGGLDPLLLKPWLPGALNLDGRFAGEASGKLLPGKRLEVSGEADFTEGKAKWQGSSGELNANLRSASLTFAWRDQTLSGVLNLALAEYGNARGGFTFPIPARYPVAPDPKGALQGTLAGKVQEHGFLTAFLPGLLQESHGELTLDLRLAGIWSDPKIEGSLQLAKAGGYLPSAGIRVSDLQLSAQLQGDQIRIDDFRAVSGGGHLDGKMLIRLARWQVAGYSGSLSGDKFQTVYLPELQMVTSPQLTFKGEDGNLTVSGELRVPEMLVTGPPVRKVVTPSRDVIMEGAPVSTANGFPLTVDGVIHLVLGDKVRVKASGIDAQLGGGMDLVLKGIDNISSSGEIRVIKGRYRAYGADLDIVRGRLYYVGDPLTEPTLDILALRTVGDVRAGVTVAGFLSAPIVKLYSEPSMPDVDILAYVVLGHPLGSSSEQGSMIAAAAGSLFSIGESDSLLEQIKARLGLNVLGMETVTPSSAGLMGYKEIPVSPSGAPAKPVASQSLMTVGKYLMPKLYFSYGRSLVTGGNLFLLRYDMFRHWQLETQSGSESGADIYYKLELN
jgi:translocation and assembly module TamB